MMQSIQPIVNFENLIFEFRGIKVMLDFDLAMLYNTETKKLKQQVKRNLDRFPPDFMFELNREEKDFLVAQVPRLINLKYSSVNPMVFTEQGVAMLSSILTTQKAVQMNIDIMRAFVRYRALILENNELRKEIKILDAKLNQSFVFLVEKIDELGGKSHKPIGFKQ